MQVLYREVITASFAGTIHSVLLALSFPSLFIQPADDSAFFSSAITTIPTYLVYVLPVIYTYGIACSIASDKIGHLLAKKSNEPRVGKMVSGSLHLVFGLVLLWFSLIGAIIFFVIDHILLRLNRPYTLLVALMSALCPILLLGACIWLAA